MDRKKYGRCHLCGEEGELSFEHVPPKKAFNEYPVVLQAIEEWIAREESAPLRGTIQQRGFGAYTLCASCNNRTGSWYAPEIVKWARRAIEILENRKGDEEVMALSVPDAFPLRFIKQVVTMIFSANGPEFARAAADLARFVLSKDDMGLPDQYRFYLSFYLGPAVRSVGIAGILHIENRKINVVSEVACPPFSYVMGLEEHQPQGLPEITHFSRFGYDEQRPVSLELPIGSGYTPFPLDFRTKERLSRDRWLNEILARLGRFR